MNDTAKDFTQSFGFIVFFVLLTLGIDLLAGDRATLWFLALVLFSMVIVNADAFSSLIRRFATA